MANGVKRKTGWDKLSYSPNEEMLFTFIDEFISLIDDFNIDNVEEQYRLDWTKDGNPSYRLGYGIWVNEHNSFKWVESETPNEIQGYAQCQTHDYSSRILVVFCVKDKPGGK